MLIEMKKSGIILFFILCGCQMALPLTEIDALEDRKAVHVHRTRPIAYDSASIELKRGTTYVAYPYWRWSFDEVHISLMDACNVSVKNRLSASTAEWSTGESVFGGWDSEAATFVESPLKELGYDVVSHTKSSFRREREHRRAELLLSAHIVDIKSNICNVFNVLYFKDVNIVAGNASIRVKWEVYDKLKDEVIATFESEGKGVVEKPTQDGNKLILLRALEDASDNLGRQEAFIRLLEDQVNVRDLIAKEKQQSVLSLKIKKVRSDPIYERISTLKRSVVQVGDDATGFFIAPDGYILTNLKAVGHAEKVAIIDNQGSRQTAHVVRRNERLGIALLYLEVTNHPYLDVADEVLLKDLSEVFTIGNPSDFQARSTLARGTVSAGRYQSQKSQHFIQTSIPTTTGYAGAPLLNDLGQVLGIHDGRNTNETSFSYYIPIHDALRACMIKLNAY